MLKIQLLSLILFLCCCHQPTENKALVLLIEKHQQTKKNFAVQDAYKLIYQSVFGVAHILEFPEHARQYLINELASIDDAENESLLEHISVSGEIVRVNLRPFKQCGGSADQLFEVMMRSAAEISGSREEFLKLWGEFKYAVEKGQLKFDRNEVENFDRRIKQKNYPAVHHSAAYRKANKPAYRVVKKSVFAQIL